MQEVARQKKGVYPVVKTAEEFFSNPQSFMSLHLKPLDIDHPLMLSFEESKLRQIEAHALIYLSRASQA